MNGVVTINEFIKCVFETCTMNLYHISKSHVMDLLWLGKEQKVLQSFILHLFCLPVLRQ